MTSRPRCPRSAPGQAVLAPGARQVSPDLLGLAWLVPAELGAEDFGNAGRDRGAAIRELLRQSHAPRKDVVERQRELVPRGPGDLALQMVDALAEREREVQIVRQPRDLDGFAAVP